MSYQHPPPGGPGQPPGPPQPGWGQPSDTPGYQSPGGPGYGAPGPAPSGYGPAPSGYGGPGYGAASVPPAKKSRRWIWILLAIFGVMVVGVGACTALIYNAARGPIDGANLWMAMVDEGDYQGAYDSTCESTRSTIPADAYAASLDADFGAGIDGYQLSSVANTNGIVTVDGTVDVGGSSRAIEFLLRNEDGWSVCSYTLGF